MAKIIKYVLCALCIVTLSACTSNNKNVSDNHQRDGIEYIVSEEVKFHYPDNFEVTNISVEKITDQDIPKMLTFTTENESLFYVGLSNESDNTKEQREVLFIEDLKQIGLIEVLAKEVVLESGDSAQQIDCLEESTGLQIQLISVYEEEVQHIYGYYTNHEVYDKNHEVINQYLMTLVVDEGVK